MAAQNRRKVARGFTLVELVVVIAVIVILAAILIPTILGVVENSRVSAAKAMVAEVGKAMKRYHDETGYWPYGGSVWNPKPGGSPEVPPTEFNTNDTALFAGAPPDLSVVQSPTPLEPLPNCQFIADGSPCWSGPYLGAGGALGAPGNRDPWGNPLRFAYYRPFDGGGGSSAFPQGFVVIWSAGPDKKDATGCVPSALGNATAAPGCSIDPIRLSKGQAMPGADDIVKLVGQAL